jgi:flagellum-specific peptidoglycan hydrolase FlgJ
MRRRFVDRIDPPTVKSDNSRVSVREISKKEPALPLGIKEVFVKEPGAIEIDAINQQKFYDELNRGIRERAEAKRLPNAEVLGRLGAAQAAAESGYGKSMPGNNPFGRKSATGQEQKTKEFIDGKMVERTEKFKVFPDVGKAADDYVDQMSKNPRFQPAGTAPTVDSALKAIGNVGYATDPKYAEVLAWIHKTGSAGKLPTFRDTTTKMAKKGGKKK